MHDQPTPSRQPLIPSASQLLAGFDAQLHRRGRAPGTRSRYGRVVRHYLHDLDQQPVATMTTARIDGYLDGWERRFQARHGQPPALASYRGQVNALRAFYRYLERASLLTDPHGRPLPDPTRLLACPPATQPTNDWLRPHEDEALLSCPSNPQERIVVALLRWTGLRVGEATQLTLTDLDLTPGAEALTVRTSKSRAGRRTLPIIPQLQPPLQAWLTHLHQRDLDSPTTPLLATRHGTRLKASFVWRLVKRVGHRAGVRPTSCSCHTPPYPPHANGCPRSRNGHNLSQISPHTLRRTFASDLLNKGLRLEVVSKLLGHASTTITEQAYAELLDDTTRRELLHTLTHAA